MVHCRPSFCGTLELRRRASRFTLHTMKLFLTTFQMFWHYIQWQCWWFIILLVFAFWFSMGEHLQHNFFYLIPQVFDYVDTAVITMIMAFVRVWHKNEIMLWCAKSCEIKSFGYLAQVADWRFFIMSFIEIIYSRCCKIRIYKDMKIKTKIHKYNDTVLLDRWRSAYLLNHIYLKLNMTKSAI